MIAVTGCLEPAARWYDGPCLADQYLAVLGDIIGFMTSGLLAMPPCAVCGVPSSRTDLVAPGELPADWERWDQGRRDRFLKGRDPGRWYFFYKDAAGLRVMSVPLRADSALRAGGQAFGAAYRGSASTKLGGSR